MHKTEKRYNFYDALIAMDNYEMFNRVSLYLKNRFKNLGLYFVGSFDNFKFIFEDESDQKPDIIITDGVLDNDEGIGVPYHDKIKQIAEEQQIPLIEFNYLFRWRVPELVKKKMGKSLIEKTL